MIGRSSHRKRPSDSSNRGRSAYRERPSATKTPSASEKSSLPRRFLSFKPRSPESAESGVRGPESGVRWPTPRLFGDSPAGIPGARRERRDSGLRTPDSGLFLIPFEELAPRRLAAPGNPLIALEAIPVLVVVDVARQVAPGDDRRAQKHVLKELQGSPV